MAAPPLNFNQEAGRAPFVERGGSRRPAAATSPRGRFAESSTGRARGQEWPRIPQKRDIALALCSKDD